MKTRHSLLAATIMAVACLCTDVSGSRSITPATADDVLDVEVGQGKSNAPQGILLQPIPEKVVVLTFDDACASQATFVAPILKQYGFGATFYVCEFGKNFANKTYYMSWEQMRSLHDMGFEIGNHTLSHPGLGGKSLDFCNRQLKAIEDRCMTHEIASPTTFCWPGYSLNKPFYSVLADKGYLFARGGGERAYSPTKDNPFNTPSFAVHDTFLRNKESFANAAKKATAGQVVIFTFHGVPDLEHKWVNTNPGRFEECMKYLKDNNYTVIAMRDLARYIDAKKASREFLTGIITPADLRCEYLVNPLGIDETKPRLSWISESVQRGQKQTAYRLLVASSRDKLDKNIGDLWDTDKVQSDRSIQVAYGGKPLQSRMRCYWKVMVWDKEEKPSSWSEPATWSMGLLNEKDWQATWIGHDTLPEPEDIAILPVPGNKGKGKVKRYLPSPHLRKEFDVSGRVLRASLYVTAQGHVEMHVNGKRVGDEYFTPGWTDYRKRIYYRTYDVTSMLSEGANAIGALLGDGWFRGNISILGQNQYGNKLRLMSQLHIDYVDGRKEIIASDPSWKASFGPIILSDMFEGETYDARKEIPGWDSPGFDDTNWIVVDTGTSIKPLVQAYPGVPVRSIQDMPTVKLTEPKPDTYVFDLGQNFSGWARLKVKGTAGDKVNMQFAEMLNPDGTVYTANLRSARAADNYILKGHDEEVWEPHFTFHGFRYVQVTGLSQKPTPDTVTGIVIQSDSPMTSSFECSNPMLNQLYSNIIWGQRSNYLEVPTDCPQRDERLGWTGDTQVFVRTGTYNQDIAAFFTKWNTDLMDTQNGAGTFGQQAPVFHGHGSPAWADAGVICPWTIYKVYGDVRMVEKHYDAMARFIDYCRSKGLSGPGGGFGDWLAIGSSTPKSLISAAYFGYTTSLMAEIAQALGKKEDATKYSTLFEDIRTHFQKTFVQADGKIAGESQTSYCLALHFNLLTDTQREQAAAHLVDRIKAKDYHLSVGFVGVSILLPTLTEIGRSDLAYRLIQNKTYPSWGYSIEQGATTIWERWNSYTKKEGFGDVGMNSFNHYAYGACGEWMFRSMLGIETDGVAFKKIIMKPELGQGITWVRGHYDSIHGRISSDWKVDSKTFQWAVTVPSNTTAILHVPAGKVTDITESSRPIKHAKGVAFLGMDHDRAVFGVDSGSYGFVSKYYQGN